MIEAVVCAIAGGVIAVARVMSACVVASVDCMISRAPAEKWHEFLEAIEHITIHL